MTDAFHPAVSADFTPRTAINYQPSDVRTDPLGHLPPRASDRPRAIREHAADLRAVMIGLDEFHELRTDQQRAAARLAQLRATRRISGTIWRIIIPLAWPPPAILRDFRVSWNDCSGVPTSERRRGDGRAPCSGRRGMASRRRRSRQGRA
jgi:hypothetical protein